MYWRDPGSEHATLRQEVLDLIEEVAQNPGYIIASSEPIPGANQQGDNPPHAKAKARYEEIVPTGFFCTQEHIDEEQPQPIVFEATSGGLAYVQPKASSKAAVSTSLAAAAAHARGAAAPPAVRVGFGAE